MPSGSDTTAASASGGPAADGPRAPAGPARDRTAHGPDRAPTGADVRSGGGGPHGADGGGADSAGGDGGRVAATARPGRARRLLRLARREARRTGLAVLAGVALALAFPPVGVWPLSLLAVAALSLLTRGRTGRQGAWTGLAFGWPFFAVLLQWVRVIGWDAALGLAFIESLFLVLLAAALAVTSRVRLWPLWGACLWITEEWARDRLPFGGFPWGRLAFANTGSPFTPLAALGGAPLVTFAVALTGTLLAAAAAAAWTLRARRAGAAADAVAASGGPRRWAVPLAVPLGLAVLLTAAGYAVPVPTAADDTADVAVVQGNVPHPGMDFLGRPMQVLDNHVDATLDLARKVDAGKVQRPDLVIWPENASDLDPFTWPEAADRIDRAARAVGVPILVGALVDDPHHKGYVDNEGIVWDPRTGPGASYTKQHPVPFGEYVPFRKELSKVITRLQRVPRDFWPGDRTGVLQTGPARLGDVICFEVAYDEIVRDTVNAGGRALVVQTNNATYGNTGQPEQQLVMARLRAVEHGRAVVTAATSGISAVVAPDGTVQQQTRQFTRQVLTAHLPLRDGRTLADRVGAAPEWVIAIVGLLSCAGAWYAGRRRRPAGPAVRPERAETADDQARQGHEGQQR